MSERIRGFRSVGDRAILVELAGSAEVVSLLSQLQEHPLDGQVDVVAGADTVLITAASAGAASRFPDQVRRIDVGIAVPVDTALVVIDTVYDGEDLRAVAELTGLDRDGVIAAHTRQIWTAAFGGFAPGFAYLIGENTTLNVPRRNTPRTAVPAGSVALAGHYSAVYPRASPGGWQLIGRTAASMWDLSRDVPALVRPGNRVRFRPVRDLVAAASRRPETAGVPADGPSEPTDGVVVRSPGPQTTIQDLGRPGFADLGVAGSGGLDRGALRRANRLAGNPPDAAVLENALGGLVLTAVTDQVLGVSGAPVSLTITETGGHDRRVPTEAPFALRAGEVLSLGAPAAGVRSYVAFRGGLDVEPVLGSRSTDTMSGIGPAPLVSGTHLRMFPAPPTAVVGAPEVPRELPTGVTVLRFVPGPRADWFDADAVDWLGRQTWTVSAQSNRIGLRLDGEPLVGIRGAELPSVELPGAELPSEGTVSGAIQVPTAGLPVLFLADHPVTGGYPVIGVVATADLDRAAQLPTGAQIRFVPVPDAGRVPSARPAHEPARNG